MPIWLLTGGTTFKIYLPAVMAATEALIRADESGAETQVTETILLVEDDPQVRNLTRTILARLGYRVLEAESADEAWGVAREHEGPMELLLTDMVMPRMSGTELARWVQAVRPEVRLLYMSGYTEEPGMLTPDTPFIQKSFTSGSLGRKVREVLRG
jgi:two-component system cell cycle sensor histidine kinase/response regulator CckA